MDFLISTGDLHECRFEEGEAPAPGDGQAVLSVDRFGLSSNNITYATFGEAMSYWKFFPAPAGWGRMPVWGFATVAESRAEGLPEGTRIYGYLPPSSELLVVPERVGPGGFVDAAPHRAELPAAYNSYQRADADPSYQEAREDQQMLLRPLFFTSWLIDDFLRDSDLFGAGAVVISSASSKTASGLAFLLSRGGGVEVLGLTSPRAAGYTRYVDISGDAAVRAAVHGHYAAELAHSAVVGATHHDRMDAVPDDLPGPRPTFFFAPDRVAKRSTEWGREGLEARLGEAWGPYVEWTDGWLEIARGEGPEPLREAYLDLLDGRIDPAGAHVLSLPR